MNNPNELNTVTKTRQELQQQKTGAWMAVIFVVALVIAIVFTALVTFSFTVNTFLPKPEEERTDLEILADLMDQHACFSPEYEKMQEAALKAFVGASGDKYTVYYTDEEYAEIQAENEGRYVGIGVTVQEETVVYEEKEITLLKIVRIIENSPATESSLSVGDYIYSIYTDGGIQYVDEVGKDGAVALIRGVVGSAVTISYLTPTESGYDLLQAGLIRAAVENISVESKISELDSSVGIIQIYRFDLTTPSQLCEAFDSLIADGVRKFVLDLRDNGGGLLASVRACASYFVKSGDLLLTKSSNEKTESIYAGYFSYAEGKSVPTEDIGKYRDYELVTLVNENTASAAELFVSVLRDYELAEMVGVRTFGKGSMQEYIPLASYGMEGVLKLTTNLYYPPCGEGYHGVGLDPDLIVPLEDGLNIGSISEWEDNQLLCAIGLLLPPIE